MELGALRQQGGIRPALVAVSTPWNGAAMLQGKGRPSRGIPALLPLFLQFFFSNTRPSSLVPTQLSPDRKSHILPQSPAIDGARQPHRAALQELCQPQTHGTISPSPHHVTLLPSPWDHANGLRSNSEQLGTLWSNVL